MAIIIETCPKCGHDLVNEVICTNPPIPKKGCPNCGWYWEGEREEVIRVPFGGNSLIVDDLVDDFKSYTSLNLTNCDVYGSDSFVVGGLVQGSNVLEL